MTLESARTTLRLAEMEGTPMSCKEFAEWWQKETDGSSEAYREAIYYWNKIYEEKLNYES